MAEASADLCRAAASSAEAHPGSAAEHAPGRVTEPLREQLATAITSSNRAVCHMAAGTTCRGRLRMRLVAVGPRCAYTLWSSLLVAGVGAAAELTVSSRPGTEIERDGDEGVRGQFHEQGMVRLGDLVEGLRRHRV